MRFGHLDLNLLVALDALLTQRSITLAGQQLHLSQSAVSAGSMSSGGGPPESLARTTRIGVALVRSAVSAADW